MNRYIDQWALEPEFRTWVMGECTFCSTLVDRIVPGRVKDPIEAAAMEAANGHDYTKSGGSENWSRTYR